ncbi:LysR family transcriptional regulator [Orrella sp. JC864]|uniref:LysR family transcriptional regulator n=1 Tax=Orrella sp. JC864 TaxID=3120298 RepID=UPI0012BC7DA5
MSSPDLPSLHAISSRLRFRQLRLLLAIDETGSLHRAADLMAMTQPGASKALRELEEIFGTELFVRSTQGLQANDIGRCVVRYARLIGTSLDNLREEMTGILRGHGARLAVGAIAGALPTVLLQAVERFRQAQPSVSIEIVEGTSARLLELLGNGQLDLAICRTSVSARPERFEFEWLHDERIGVAAGPRHRLAQARAVSLAELAACPWVLFPSQMPLRTLLERELIEAGLPFPQHAIETSSTFASVLLLSESRELVSLFSAETVDFFARHGMLRRLPIEIGARAEPWGVVRRRGSPPLPAAALLIDAIRQAAQAFQAPPASHAAPVAAASRGP